MIRDLPFFGIRAKAEPRRDPWPPTWRLQSGAIQVEASFREPGRQKLIDKATKAVAFLALAFIALGHEQWPLPELVVFFLDLIAGPGPIPITEQAAAWLFVAVIGIGLIVGTFRLLLAALGVDQGKVTLIFDREHLLIDGSTFNQQCVKGFELEPHQLGKIEGHNEKRLGEATSLYYRDAYTIILYYGERRTEIAHVLGRKQAGALLVRLQELGRRTTDTVACLQPAATQSRA